MNLRWNHILLACLLTVLEIYGTEAIPLYIQYSIHTDSKDPEYSATQLSCDGKSFAMLKPDDATAPFSFTFVPTRRMTNTDQILFKVQQANGKMCAVLYKPSEVVVTDRSPILSSLTIKSARQTDNVDGKDEIRLFMNDVRQVINGIESESTVQLLTNGAHWVLELPKVVKFTINYRVGTYPAGPTPSGNVLSKLWKSSRLWNFTPIGHMLTADFSCSTSMPVEFFCPNDHCNYINYRAAPNTVDMTVLAYVVPNNSGGYRLMKGNRKTAPTDLLCTLYVESAALEIQFPGRRKRHINVAHLGTDEVRSGRGFRLYMNSIQLHNTKEEEDSLQLQQAKEEQD